MATPRLRMVTKKMPFADTVQLGVIDKLGFDVQPVKVLVGDGLPEHDEPHQLAVLLGSRNVGIGIE
jgi:hypothetical protein